MKKRVLLIAVLLIAALGGLLSGCGNRAAGGTTTQPTGRLIPKVAAPDFALTGIDGGTVSLGDLKGSYVVLFFSGGLKCLPCLAQIGDLNKDLALNSHGTVAFSVVPDSPSAWQKAIETSSSLAGARPLFDTDGSAYHAYEALEFSTLMRLGLHMSHTYFVINRQGLVVSAIDDSAMGVRTQQLATLVEQVKEIESGSP